MQKGFLLSFLLLFLGAANLFSQKVLRPAELVASTSLDAADWEMFSRSPFKAAGVLDETAARFARDAQFLTLDEVVLDKIVRERPKFLSVRLPFNGKFVVADLVGVDILTPDFKLETSESQGRPVAFKDGLHYQGILRGDENSLAAFSFFEGEIMGLMSSKGRGGNLVLGKLDLPNNKNKYIFYDDSKVAQAPPLVCSTPDDVKAEFFGDEPAGKEVNGCVRIFFETDFALFTNKGSVQNVINYVTGAFNQMAIMYTNETISVQLSQVFCWVTQDAYSTTSSSTALNQFAAFRTSFNADLAHLVVIGGNSTGGVAFLSGICTTGSKYAYSDINTTFSNVPTYSWTIMVLTHETGHNMSSRHTHWCGWTGGAIDNCATPEGSCNPGPAPTNGGTVMSYCHQTVGINLANGFGPQPGNAIRNYVSSRTCLAATCTPFPSCNPPTAISVTGITNNAAVITWTAVTGATSYTLTYRAVGAATWTTINSAVSPASISGLPANDEIEVTIRTNCSSANSGYRTGVIFKTTTGGGGSCGTPTGLAMSGITSTSAIANWTAVTGATSYEVSWKLASATAWGAAVTVTNPTHTVNGLVANSAYNLRVRAICGSLTSAYATVNFSTTSASACNPPATLTATATSQTAATATWAAAANATNYRISWKTAAATTWGAESTVSGTTFSITGLTAGTAYNVRVRTNCNGTFSGYIQANFTTQAAPVCPAPTNFFADALSPNSALASWSAVSGANLYQISRKLTSSSTWTNSQNTTATTASLTGLLGGTTYDLRVRARCGTSFWSAYAFTQVTTPSNLIGDDRNEAIAKLDLETAIVLAPNPTNSFSTVSMDLPTLENVEVNVLDAFGRVLFTQTEMMQAGAFQLDLTDFAKGVYFVRVKVGEQNQTIKRLVKSDD